MKERVLQDVNSIMALSMLHGISMQDTLDVRRSELARQAFRATQLDSDLQIAAYGYAQAAYLLPLCDIVESMEAERGWI